MRAEGILFEKARVRLAANIHNHDITVRHLVNYLSTVSKVEVLAEFLSKLGFNLRRVLRHFVAQDEHRAITTDLYEILDDGFDRPFLTILQNVRAAKHKVVEVGAQL